MIPSGATVLFLLEASRFRPFRHAHPFSYCPLAFGWRGVASRHFSPSSSSQSPLVDAASALVLLLRSCHRAAHHTFFCSPPTAPPSSSSSPLPANPEWSSRSSSLATRRQEGVSGSQEVQPLIFSHYPLPGRRLRIPGGPAVHLTRYPLPGRRIRTPSGPAVHLYSPSAARKAYPDRGWFRRSSSIAIRLQEGVSGPRLVQAFIVTRYPPPGRRIRTPSGPAVHLYSPSAARKAYPDRGWSRRSSSIAIRLQEGVSGPRLVQAFIVTRYPPPGRRIRTATGPGVYLHSLSATRRAYSNPEWSRRSSALAIRLQEGISGPRVVQSFIFTRYPPPGRRIRTPNGPGVHPHSLSASRKAYRDPEWSSRSSSLAIRCQEGVSGPPVVHPFIFSRYPPPGRRFRTATGPGVHLRSSIRLQEGVYGPEGPTVLLNSPIRRSEDVCGSRMVQSFSSARLPATR